MLPLYAEFLKKASAKTHTNKKYFKRTLFMHTYTKSLTLAVLLALGTSPVFAAKQPTTAELMEMIKSQQAMLKKQNELIEQLSQKIEEVEENTTANTQAVEATVEAIESSSTGTGTAWDRLSIGGYGELHYNNLEGKGGASDKKQMDFHRFVLFTGYEFTDNLRFFSEVELEHSLSGDGKPGEVELEQAYIEYDINDAYSAKAGLFLLPIGFLNETHEPPTFYGVERNNVEKNIIPTTWWEGGAGISGRYDNGISWGGFVHSGLSTSDSSNFAVRKGRQKVAEASAEDLAATFNLKYTGIPGFEVGAAVQYQEDITQSTNPDAGSAWLYEVHGAYQVEQFTVKALYASWNLDGDAPKAVGADEQTGYYIEPSWRITDSFGIFARYSVWDNKAGDNVDSESVQYDFGVNYWLHPQVVLKADYQTQDNDSGQDRDGINLGVGYHF